MASRFVAALAVLPVAMGCGSEERSTGASRVLEDVEVLEAGSIETIPALAWRLGDDPYLRIGGAREGEAHQIVEITAAVMDPDGSVLIADGLAGWLRRYGPEGEFREQLGAVGDGPGEFRSPSSLAWLPGDSLGVWDRALWRMSVLDAHGGFVRSERYDPTAAGVFPLEGMWPVELKLARDGTRLLRLVSKGNPKEANPTDAEDTGLALHRAGAPAAELLARLPGEAEVEVDAPWGPTRFVPPLAGGPKMAFDPVQKRACVGHQEVPEILCVDKGGNRSGVRWVAERRPVDPADPVIARWRSETVTAYRAKVGDQVANELTAQIPLPEWHPAFGNLFFDSMGFLWVELGPVGQIPVEREYLVLTDDLDVAGRLTLPSLRVLEVGAEYVLGISYDELGVQELAVFPLRR